MDITKGYMATFLVTGLSSVLGAVLIIVADRIKKRQKIRIMDEHTWPKQDANSKRSFANQAYLEDVS